MTDRFSAARLKIKRANEHIAALGRLTSSLPNAYTSSVEPNSGGGQTLKYTPPNVAELELRMALIMGDALHNLRTAIEYAYLGAIQRHAPTTLDSYTKFPTGKIREEVENRLRGRKIDVLSPKLFNGIVSNIKPYEISGNVFVPMLHDLDISDKHWLLIPIMRVADIRDIVVEDQYGIQTTGNTYPIVGNGPHFLDFPPNYKIKDNGKITLDVVFDEVDGISFLKGTPIMEQLEIFFKTASQIVEILDRI